MDLSDLPVQLVTQVDRLPSLPQDKFGALPDCHPRHVILLLESEWEDEEELAASILLTCFQRAGGWTAVSMFAFGDLIPKYQRDPEPQRTGKFLRGLWGLAETRDVSLIEYLGTVHILPHPSFCSKMDIKKPGYVYGILDPEKNKLQ